jgi:hypothetical protein
MVTYWLYLEGKGDGCDYTVGCNEKLTQLFAVSLRAAKAEALEELGYEEGCLDEEPEPGEVESALIFEVSAFHEVDLEDLRAQRAAKAQRAEQARLHEH